MVLRERKRVDGSSGRIFKHFPSYFLNSLNNMFWGSCRGEKSNSEKNGLGSFKLKRAALLLGLLLDESKICSAHFLHSIKAAPFVYPCSFKFYFDHLKALEYHFPIISQLEG